MKRLIAAVALLLVAPVFAWSQDAGQRYRGQGYAFFGVGTETGSSGSPFKEHVGGGGEGFLYKGFGLGGEFEYTRGGSAQFDQALIGSVYASYHFGRHAPRGALDPFVLGGVSLVGPTQKGNGRGSPAGNVGGGANLWVARHAAVRFEFRDVIGADFWPYTHVLEFRAGMTFR